MKLRHLLGPGLAVLGFAALSSCAPTCQAQEVDPDQFTLTGVETFPERGASVPSAAKSSSKIQPGLEAKQAKQIAPVVQGRKAPVSSADPATLAPAALHERKASPTTPKKNPTPAPSN
jgi:hypothetical protein